MCSEKRSDGEEAVGTKYSEYNGRYLTQTWYVCMCVYYWSQ